MHIVGLVTCGDKMALCSRLYCMRAYDKVAQLIYNCQDCISTLSQVCLESPKMLHCPGHCAASPVYCWYVTLQHSGFPLYAMW
jgi:hypothetical protein